MSNLLPSGERVRIALDSAHAALLGFASLLLLALLVASLSLAPSLFVFKAAETSMQGAPSLVRAQQSDIQSIRVAQQLMVSLAPIASTTPLATLQAAIAARPSGITIDRIAYTRMPTPTVVLSGFADRREDVDTYRASLNTDSRFGTVSVPVSALVGSADGGRFTVTLSDMHL